HQACSLEGCDVDRLARIKATSIDSALQIAERDLVELVAAARAEAALRQAPMERHLATLEAADRNARTRGLALAAAAARLADAGADAAADPDARLTRTGIVLDVVEPHG